MVVRDWSLKGAIAQATALVLAVGAVVSAAMPAAAQAQQQQPSFELLADINTGRSQAFGLNINEMGTFNGKLYMAATGEPHLGFELYEYDPATDKVRLISDIRPGGSSSFPSEFQEYDGKLYFRASTYLEGHELFVYDPVTDTVELLIDLHPGQHAGSTPNGLVVFDNKLYFNAEDGSGTPKVFQYDSATGETIAMTGPSSWGGLVATDNGLWMVLTAAETDPNTNEKFFLYRHTAGSAGFTRVDIAAPTAIASANFYSSRAIKQQDGVIVALPYSPVGGAVLFDTNQQSITVLPALGSTFDNRNVVISDGRFWWFDYASSGSGFSLHSVAAGETALTEHPSSTVFNYVSPLYAASTGLYFGPDIPTVGVEPWRYVPGTDSFEALGDLYPGIESSRPRWFNELNGVVYAGADLPDIGNELIAIGAGDTEFALVQDFGSVENSSIPQNAVALGRDVFFVAITGDQQQAGAEPVVPATEMVTGQQVQDDIPTVDSREVYRVNVDTRVVKKMTNFSSSGEAPSFGNLHIMGDMVVFAMNTQQAGGLYVMSPSTGSFTSVTLPENLIVGSTMNFGADRVLVQLLDPMTFSQELYLLNPDLSLVTFDSVTVGIDVDNVSRVVAFGDYLYFHAVNKETSESYIYRYSPTTHIVEQAFDSTVIGYSTSNSTYYGMIESIAGDRLVFTALVPSGFRSFMLTSSGEVLPFVGMERVVYSPVVVDEKLIFVDYNTSFGVYDLATDTFTEVSYTPATADPTSFYEQVVVFEGQALIKGGNLTHGYGELFALDLTDNSVSPYVSTMPGAANMDIGPMLQLSDQIVAPAFRDDVGYELFTLISNRAPEISGTPALTVAQDAAYSFTPTASDADNDALTFSISGKPAWASFSTSTGALTGTPGNSDVGVFENIVISVTDGKATSSLAAFTITVTNVNDAPTISGTPATSVLQDQLYSFQAVGADIDVGDELTYSSTALPLWLSLNAQTGLLSGTPANADVGTTPPIVISVSDGQLTASLPAFAITVINVNDAPTISGTPAVSVDQDQLYSFQPVASDVDLGDELTFAISGKPAWLSFNTASGLLSGTPTNDDVGVYSNIVISVSDIAGASAALPAFAITVVNVNDAPVISGTPSTSVNQDQAYSFVPVASDIDVGDQLTFSIVNKPTWAAFNMATGALTGTPTNSDVGATSGIVISVSDGELSASLPAFTLTVVNVNDAPTISGTPDTSVDQDQPYSFQAIGADIDAEDVLTYSSTELPSWLSLNAQTGLLSGTPANADVGVTATIVITVTDLAGASASLPGFAITVVNVNDAPVITNTPLLSIRDGEAYSFVPQVSDPDTAVDPEESFTFTITNQPTWASFDTSTGALTGTPGADDVAEWTGITITVTDRDGLSDSVGPFTITVGASDLAPVVMDDNYVVNIDEFSESYNFPILDNDFDPEGQDLLIVEFRTVSGPGSMKWNFVVENGRLRASGVSIVGVPAGFLGQSVFEYALKDTANNRSGKATVTITFVGDPVITLTPPADVTINATGALTKVDQSQLGTATATLLDSPIGVGVIKPQDSDVYLSGVHTFTWVAGMARNEVSKPQQLRIIPQVTLEKDITVNTGVGIDLPVTLSGPPPSYPHSVIVLVNDEPFTVLFASGTETKLQLPSLQTEGSYRVTIASSENIGAVGSVEVTVGEPQVPAQIPGTARPPRTFSSEFITITVPAQNGKSLITEASSVTAVLKPTMEGILDQSASVSSIRVDNFKVFIGAFTQPGGYFVAVSVTTDGKQYAINIPIVVLPRPRITGDDSIMAFEYNPEDEDLSRELDQNDNGFVDYEDGRWDDNVNGIPAYLDRAFNSYDIWADGAYAVTAPNLHFMAYPSLDDASSIRVASVPDAAGNLSLDGFNAFTQVGMDISSYRFYGEFYRFLLLELANEGDQVPVVLPLDEPIGAGAEFLLWQDGAWRAFAEGAGGSLYSASSVYGACPTIGSAAWQPGLNEGHWCVQLVITDGGVNDTDGAANGMVDVFGGVAIDSTGNAAPVAVADSATAVWRGSVSIPVLANDTDADGDSLSIVSASVDVGTVTVNAARTVLQFVSPGDFAGVATITYVVTDNNGGMAVGTATVTVLENRAPVLGADSAVTVAGRPVTVNVLANDVDPDGDSLSITAVSVAATSGTASYSGSSVTFVPAAGFVGVATVSYSVSDNRGGTATGTLTVQVAAAPEVIQVRPATGSFWWFLTVGGLLLAWRRRSA